MKTKPASEAVSNAFISPFFTKTVTVGISRKYQHEYLAGRKYESTELFEEESETVPSTFDELQIKEVHDELLRRVEARIAERLSALTESLKAAPPF